MPVKRTNFRIRYGRKSVTRIVMMGVAVLHHEEVQKHIQSVPSEIRMACVAQHPAGSLGLFKYENLPEEIKSDLEPYLGKGQDTVV